MGRFSIDLTEIAEELPLVPEGFYKARIADGEVRTGESDNGPWTNFSLALVIEDPEIIEVLGIDEPRVYFGGMLSFDDSTGAFNKKRCPQLGSFIAVCDYGQSADFEDDETDAADSERKFYELLVANMITASIGTDLMVKVAHQSKSKKDSDIVSRGVKIAKVEE